MPLWNGLATALGREAADLVEDLGGRTVMDTLVGAEALRTVLLCESPHHAEISHGHPLAGGSGETVTRAFARNLDEFEGREEPIGCLLYRNSQNANGQLPPPVNRPVLNSLGLMNVSRLPLDSKAYCLDARRQYSELLCYFEAVKSRLEKKTPEQGIRFLRNLPVDHAPSQVYNTLRDDLFHRREQLGQNVVIVPCGKVASAFYYWATGNYGYRDHTIGLIPHPSRNSWQRQQPPGLRAAIDTLVETIAGRAA